MNKKYKYMLLSEYVDNHHIKNKMIKIYDDSIITYRSNYDITASYMHLDGKIKKIKSFIVDDYEGYRTYVLLDNGKLLYCASDNIISIVDTDVSDFAYITTNEKYGDKCKVFIKYNNDTAINPYNDIHINDVKYIFNNAVYLKNNDIIVYGYEKQKKFNVANVKQIVIACNTLFVLTNDKKLIIYDINTNTCKGNIGINANYIVKSADASILIISEDNLLYTCDCYNIEQLIIKSYNIKNIIDCGVFRKTIDINNIGHYKSIIYAITDTNELYCVGGDYGDSLVKVKNDVKEVCGWCGEFCYVDIHGNTPVNVYESSVSKYLINPTDFNNYIINNKSNNISANQMVIYLKDDGIIMTCGNNQFGQLGLGDTNDRNVLTEVPNIADVKQVCCSDKHSMILFNDGTIATCGNGRFGQLGLGNNENKNTFTKVPGITNVEQISCGGNSSMIKLTNGDIMTCGDNTVGQLCLGDNKNRNTFTKVNI